jgi:HlyD family secretion protein
MLRKNRMLIPILAVIVVCALLAAYSLSKKSNPLQLQLSKATRRDIKVTVNTNGIIDPVNRSEIYAPIDARVVQILKMEGSEIAESQPLMQLASEPIRTALAEAKAALLSQRRQARTVMIGPSKEEIADAEAPITEYRMQLDQLKKDLQVEESLLAKGATTRSAVENLHKQRDLLQLRLDNSMKRKSDLLQRYSQEDKELEQGKIDELVKHVASLEKQLMMESVLSPAKGLIYSMQVRAGSYVTRGQLLAQIYQPGKIMLRAYVDEPDLGRIKKGQTVQAKWDGMPDRQWNGVVEKPAEQVVALNNRSVGYVLCSIDGNPKELIPNLNIKVEITTDLKRDVLVVPRIAVFRRAGTSAILAPEGERTVTKSVVIGLVTSDDIEILSGIKAGDFIVTDPGEANK